MSTSRNAGTTLESKYVQRSGHVYLSGTQALVRLAIEQRWRDSSAGLDTAGYVSGYRGSPLGRYDMELAHARQHLEPLAIRVRPAVNEDLAATALWGTQYVGQIAGSRHSGVFGIWYGKGPGVDRCGDVFRHANSAGTSALGGVLAIAGDDHGARSSTVVNFSDQIFMATGMPLLYPSSVQELLDLGLHGIAMSRHSGCWVGLKAVTDIVEAGGTVDADPARLALVMPGDTASADRHVRLVDNPLAQERRLFEQKLPAAIEYARANSLNRVTADEPGARVGVIAAGKAYQDVMQMLGTQLRPQACPLRVAKLGLVWPLDPEFIARFAHDLDLVLVVEEKRPLLENQIKAILYDAGGAQRTLVTGKFFSSSEYASAPGRKLLPRVGEIEPAGIARALVAALARHHGEDDAATPLVVSPAEQQSRAPSFCSGCPHSRSTRLPDGSRALAGIGCHTIAMFNDPARTTTVSQMGGEGVMWLGQQPFTDEGHVFANMGDGTYFHSGLLAIRQAIAAGATITYKLLVNGFVAMTGGQRLDGELPVDRMVRELAAEGVNRIAIVSDEPGRFREIDLPPKVPVHHRSELDAVQRELRQHPGVSVLLYDQPCATERRRLRKRGEWPDSDRRTIINSLVCEGCGDCGKASGCLSIEPLDTPLGRKRRINQSSCNRDFSCIDGFCPSFVTVVGGKLRRTVRASPTAHADPAHYLPAPQPAVLHQPWSVLITGIGGTGVVTVGQVLGMAAHLDGLSCSTLDVTGLAQKYGTVMSHIRLARSQSELHAPRIGHGEADAVIGCDLLATGSSEALRTVRAGHTSVIVATDPTPTAEFSRNPDWRQDSAALLRRIRAAAMLPVLELAPVQLAADLLGEPIAANMFMLGVAWQRGLLPVSLRSMQQAIDLNGVQKEGNQLAFSWGRRTGHDAAAVAALVDAPAGAVGAGVDEPLELMIERRERFLVDYQDAAMSGRYRALLNRVARAEALHNGGYAATRAAARSYFSLLAHKDGWEIARLYSSPEFRQELTATFEGDYRLRFHIGVWPFARRNPAGGPPLKGEVGPWLLSAFRVMAPLRFLRGTWLDPFARSAERRLNDRLLREFESDVDVALSLIAGGETDRAVQLLSLPQEIRGFGHVREAASREVARRRQVLLEKLAQRSATGYPGRPEHREKGHASS